MEIETKPNSIMDYYARVSERYYVARVFDLAGKTRVKFLWEPTATPVKVPGYEQFDLFIYREGKSLVLVEALTGAVVINQAELGTRELRRMNKGEFVKSLPLLLKNRGGVSEMNILIVNFLGDHDQALTPRYKYIGV